MDEALHILPASSEAEVTDWDILFPWENGPPRQIVTQTFFPNSFTLSLHGSNTATNQTPLIDPNFLCYNTLGLPSPSNDKIPTPFDIHISALLPTNSDHSNLMDIRRAAALSLPPTIARKPAFGNEITPSPFRPHVPADRRILFWTTPYSLGAHIKRNAEVSPWLQALMFEGLLASTVPTTRQAYGAGLLRFSQFCDAEGVPESSRMPASSTLLGAFIANYIGSGSGNYSSFLLSSIDLPTPPGKMIRNWLNGLRLWHIFNDADWHGKEGWIPALTKSADKKGVIFKRSPRGPVTIEHLRALHLSLDCALPRDAAIWAAATIAFWGCRRLGELLILSITKFSSEHDTTRSTRISRSSVNGHRVISFHLSWTKTTGIIGSECILTKTFDNLCPIKAFETHLRINHSPPDSTPLFSFRTNNNAWSPLLKSHFLSFTSTIYKLQGLENVFGHSYRIGGSLKLLLDGVAPEIIMKLGGWTSLCFLIYWRRLEQVLPIAITRAWAPLIKDFTIKNGLHSDVVDLVFE